MTGTQDTLFMLQMCVTSDTTARCQPPTREAVHTHDPSVVYLTCEHDQLDDNKEFRCQVRRVIRQRLCVGQRR